MSIFKESFRDYVKKQFGVRQAVISRGNSDRAGLGPTSRMQSLPADPKRGIPKIQAGAFFSYNQKQCVIRLSSMVDLMEDIGLDLGGNYEGGGGSTFESYKGETFARNFILEGGVLSDYARNNVNGEQVTRKLEEVRGGFPSSKKKVNLSYGDPSIASDPRGGSDGYGAVPKPGIVDANIRTKSAYGSLREAKVNFVCHNLRQLEILELLYMRPGYPVLMEWGWSPFINNEGNVVNTFDSMSDNDWFWDDGSKEMNQNFIQKEIIKRKKSFNGNYDGFIGFVTNFSYTARPDGGFNCSTELISMGEVLDSLKVPGIDFSTYSIDDNDELKEQKLYQSTLGRLLKDINNFADRAAITKSQKDLESLNNTPTGNYNLTSEQQEDLQNYLEQLESEVNESNENLSKALKGSISDFIIQKDQVIFDSTQSEKSKTSKIQTKEGFVRWDGLAALINNYVIPTNEKGHKPITIETTIVPSDIDTESDPDPLLYCSYEDINNQIMDVSCDAKTCILPHQFSQFENDEISLTLSGRIKRFWSSGWDFKGIKEAFTAESAPDDNSLDNYIISEDISKRRIGSIFIGIDLLNDVFKSTFLNNENATLGDFLKNIWKKINEQCPMHNFVLRVDQEYTNAIQVIDLPISTNDLKKLNYDDLFEFNVHSNDTIVREFKYDTQIPDALKATIAINAQSGATADDLDSVTFAAFNRSIKSRLSSLSEKFSDNEAKNYKRLYKLKKTKKERLNELKVKISDYNRLFFNIGLDKKEDEDLESIYGNIKAIIKEAQSLELYLEQSTSGYLKNQAIIPINLTLTIDGISGIVIGNVFRVDPSRLPRAYRQRRVGFVALGEDQNITSGQDWTTNIRGQLILFPSLEEIKNLGQLRSKDDFDLNKEIGKEVAKELELFSVAESTSTTGPGTILETRINQVEEALADQVFVETYRGINIFQDRVGNYKTEIDIFIGGEVDLEAGDTLANVGDLREIIDESFE